jgi:hypothetical protein
MHGGSSLKDIRLIEAINNDDDNHDNPSELPRKGKTSQTPEPPREA